MTWDSVITLLCCSFLYEITFLIYWEVKSEELFQIHPWSPSSVTLVIWPKGGSVFVGFPGSVPPCLTLPLWPCALPACWVWSLPSKLSPQYDASPWQDLQQPRFTVKRPWLRGPVRQCRSHTPLSPGSNHPCLPLPTWAFCWRCENVQC